MILSYILLPQLSIPSARELKRQHPELAPATPHKLRHTAATLAKKAGRSIDEISEALTHSDQSITKTYINTKNTVKQTVGETASRIIKKS